MWLAVVGLGMAGLWRYANTPGPPARASVQWPLQAKVERDRELPTLILFVHPECGCSTATISELATLMTRAQGRVRAQVLVFRPGDAPAGWEQSRLWQAAEAIDGVDVATDVDAAEATRFGAYVSGQALLYDRHGGLAFDGGITYARGHAGLNDGRLALTALLTGNRPHVRRTPVFGCLLRPAPHA